MDNSTPSRVGANSALLWLSKLSAPMESRRNLTKWWREWWQLSGHHGARCALYEGSPPFEQPPKVANEEQGEQPLARSCI